MSAEIASELAASKSLELLDAANKGLEKIYNLAEEIERGIKNDITSGLIPGFEFDNYYREFEKVMDDDFNSPQGLAVIFDFVKAANTAISNNLDIDSSFFIELKKFINKTAVDVFGIFDFEELNKKRKK